MNKLLTPGDLVRKYPALQRRRWDAATLGVLLRAGLLSGARGQDCSLIDEESLIRLAKFADELAEAGKFRLA